MLLHHRILYPLLIIATGINVLGLPIAVLQAEPWHATLHAGLALACGFWALRLRYRRTGSEYPARPDQPDVKEGPDSRELEGGERGAMEAQWLRDRRALNHEERRE